MLQIRTALLAAALAFGFAAGAQAAGVPDLNVERMCRDAARDNAEIKLDADRCLRSEREARDQLAKQWPDFPAPDQALCTQTATMGGTASYVELITCLEMRRDAARLTTAPAALRDKR
jgi:hypothetical protein